MLFNRLLDRPNRSFFLFGIRGAGKSTWIQADLPDATYIDLLDDETYLAFSSTPGLLRLTIQEASNKEWVVIDEIQRLPNLLNDVHRHISSEGQKFALLGSSARKLKTQSSNLLAGRASQRFIYPFTPEEIGNQFKLEEVLRFGSIPVIWGEDDKEDVLRSYVNMYLREEIRQEALVRNLPGFTRFLLVAAVLHGQLINIRGISRDSQVPETTVTGFFDVLEDTLIATRLHGFEAKLRIRERKHPKLYFVDPGLVRALKSQFGSVSVDERGSLFEGWIHTLLLTYRDNRKLFDSIHYWSPHGTQTEVDFLIHRGVSCIAIEVKSGTFFNEQMLKGLKAIDGLSGLVRRILVYCGARSYRTNDGIEIWPVDRFVESLAENRLWP